MKVWCLMESVCGDSYTLVSIHTTKIRAEEYKKKLYLSNEYKEYYDYDIVEFYVDPI